MANYLKSFGWEAGQAAVFPALVNGTDYRGALFTGTKSFYPLSELRERGVIPYGESPGNLPATLIELENDGGNEYWLGFNNFFVITRYNRSVNYAMSVLQLANEIGPREIHIPSRSRAQTIPFRSRPHKMGGFGTLFLARERRTPSLDLPAERNHVICFQPNTDFLSDRMIMVAGYE